MASGCNTKVMYSRTNMASGYNTKVMYSRTNMASGYNTKVMYFPTNMASGYNTKDKLFLSAIERLCIFIDIIMASIDYAVSRRMLIKCLVKYIKS